jgi:hypothetical protein
MTPSETSWAAIFDWFCRDSFAVPSIIPEAIVFEIRARPTIKKRTRAPTIKDTFRDNFMIYSLSE